MEREHRAKCDDCVPRGCSCNAELKAGIEFDSPAAEQAENWIEPVDAQGRKYPCCEWMHDADGWETGVYGVDVLEQSYQKSLTRDEGSDKVDV